MLAVTSAEAVGLAAAHGIDRAAALDAYRRFHRAGAADAAWIDQPAYLIGAVIEEGATRKFTLRLADGRETESVILPMRSRVGRLSHTLCLSSQVGCAMGCAFCETARMGLLRGLSPAEIVSQWFIARHVLGAPVRNIVFMGMGEPMENLEAVMQAIRVLTDRNGPGLAPADIAVSTVGRVGGIRRLAAFASQPGFRRLKLAVSINAPNDAVRSSIMPINRAEPLEALFDAIRLWQERGMPVLLEYVVIPGVNDQPSHADELAARVRDLACKVNVIPYNPRRDSPWPAPADEVVDAFVERLRGHGVFVTRRRTLGRSVMAACGQLGNPDVRRGRGKERGSFVPLASIGANPADSA
jgi:23S rRNA (adenine2503-C2)-methyltransferase